MIRAVWLSTRDNPWDPWTQFTEWLNYDLTKNEHRSCNELVAVFAKTSDAFTREENIAETERAIDEIIKYDPFNVYVKLEKEIE